MNTLGRKLIRSGLPMLFFVLAAAGTFLLSQRARPNQAQTAPSLNVEALDSIPGVAEGQVVRLPRLPSLRNESVELNAVKQKYLLCAFISSECATCAEDQRFWKDVSKETAASVDFHVISIDVDKSMIERYAKAYQFDDLSVLFDPDRQALTTFNIRFVPQYILLTPEGKVVSRWNGLRRYDPKQTTAIDSLPGLRPRI